VVHVAVIALLRVGTLAAVHDACVALGRVAGIKGCLRQYGGRNNLSEVGNVVSALGATGATPPSHDGRAINMSARAGHICVPTYLHLQHHRLRKGHLAAS